MDTVLLLRSPFASIKALTKEKQVASCALLPLANGETFWWLATGKYTCDNSGSMRRFLLCVDFYYLFLHKLVQRSKTLGIDRGAASSREETH